MKNIKGLSVKIIVSLLIISLFYNFKLMQSTKKLNEELIINYETKLNSINTELYSVLKTMNLSISNNKIYVGETGIVKDYYERDLREISITFVDLSRLNNTTYSNADLKEIDISSLRNTLSSYSEFLDLLYKRHEKSRNKSEQYIDLNSNDLEGITIIKDSMEDLLNVITSTQGNKDRLINIMQELTNYSKSKEFEEKRLKIKELTKSLSQG
ncbi:hypothetical protein ACFFF5_08935 [Lederbergia wuyishanensis]|uniref:Uncharacterized protein n=1 Tax=Lederbergia wuyishanensis TaxID=1347903 RepID=A0ABU0D608_9BACI|nr:hypothetical protein [Lederbergia wuyishanensis]MCJ8008727.1 hypothetical protein [Lederbergia wuyishanensis]MDQ0343852.1 hypothetical protein [Lederbergia wuyishanensis]